MSSMKQTFGKVAPETYEEREKRLQEAADLIENRLAANDPPQPRLQPKGAMRAEGDRLGRQAAQRQKMSIEEELAQIRKERGQREQVQTQTKGKSL